MSNIQVIWNGDENGLWDGDKHIATLGQIERAGYNLDNLLGMTQKQLDKVVAYFNREANRKPVLSNRSIEDMLGY